MQRLVYLSGPFGRQAEVRELRDKIHEQTSWKVNSSWLDEDDDGLPNSEKADRDFQEVVSAHAFIKFCNTETVKSTGGKNQEMGVALCAAYTMARLLGIPHPRIAIVGPKEGVLDYMTLVPIAQITTDHQAVIEYLKGLEK